MVSPFKTRGQSQGKIKAISNNIINTVSILITDNMDTDYLVYTQFVVRNNGAKMKKLSKVVVFRLSEEDYEKYIAKVNLSEYNASEFFRNAVVENKTSIITKDNAISLLYQLNKIGNNFNQLTHRVHLDNIEGKVNDLTYRSVLKSLKLIESKLDALLRVTLHNKKSKNQIDGDE